VAYFTLGNAQRGRLDTDRLGFVSPFFTLDDEDQGVLGEDILGGEFVGFVIGESTAISAITGEFGLSGSV